MEVKLSTSTIFSSFLLKTFFQRVIEMQCIKEFCMNCVFFSLRPVREGAGGAGVAGGADEEDEGAEKDDLPPVPRSVHVPRVHHPRRHLTHLGGVHSLRQNSHTVSTTLVETA